MNAAVASENTAGLAYGVYSTIVAFATNASYSNGSSGKNPRLWEVTRNNTDKIVRHSKFGKIYRHKTTGLWWSKDTAGHGKSVWKVFVEKDGGLSWIADADEFGNFILFKHKGDIGKFIPWKELGGSGF